MTVPNEEFHLAADFPAATAQQWRQLSLAVLRKAGTADDETALDAVEDLLSRTTYDGVRIAPLYTRDDAAPPPDAPGLFPFTRGTQAAGSVVSGWDVRQRYVDPDPKRSRDAILADLENGVTSLWLRVGPGGLPVTALPEALEGVLLDLAGIVLDAGDQTPAAAEALFSLVDAAGVPAGEVSGNLGFDPLGWRARTNATDRLGDDLTLAAGLARRCADQYPALRAVTVDATVFHDAGASDAEELGCALATGVAYLRALTTAGLDLTTAFGQLEFRYAATADQFATIAKLRAARRMWARVAQVCGVPDAGAQRQHAVTSSAMMTARDPWVNLLRTTLACFAAGVGGAESVTVLPFDNCLGLPDAFARRLARNTHSLLVEEANVARVVDPAGGSWYVEQLTEDLAQASWSWFQEIEQAGGMAAALDHGLVAERLASTWQQRATNVAHRRDPITGVSEFPHLLEELPHREPAPAQPAGGLPRHRYAEQFEALRDRADAHLSATGVRPTVFLATLGPVAAHTARATFAANLFAAGGIATVSGGTADDSPEQLAAAFTASGATVACLCASDKLYAQSASAVASALAAAGARRVWLAGRPGDYEAVDDYLFAGCDAVAILTSTLRDLGVAE